MGGSFRGICDEKYPPLYDQMSMDRSSGEWNVEGLLLMDGVESVICVSLCMYFSNVRVCGCMDNMQSVTDVWYLVRIIDLGGCGWKEVVSCIYIFSGFFKGEIRGACSQFRYSWSMVSNGSLGNRDGVKIYIWRTLYLCMVAVS